MRWPGVVIIAGLAISFHVAKIIVPLHAEPSRSLAKPSQADSTPEPPGAMTFRLISAPKLCSNCDVVVATGDIVETSAQDFEALLEWNRLGGKKIYFIVDSAGGSVLDGWQIARRLRAISASVIAGRVDEHVDGSAELTSGSCISICNALLISGTERRLATGTTFGVHQFSNWNATFANLDNKVTVRDIREQLQFAGKWLAFAREMGSDPRLVEAQFGVMSEKVDFIAPETLAQWKITNAPASSLPKTLRDPGQGGALLQTLVPAGRPAGAGTGKPVATVAGLAPLAAPQRLLSEVPKNGDRQWSPVLSNGDWRESTVESQADFAKVTFACSTQGTGFILIILRGIPEARQRQTASEIVENGMGFAGRPVDIAQTSMGFGSNFWIKFHLMPDQFNAFLGLHGQVAFIPGAASGAGQKLAVNFQTSGFEAMMLKARQECVTGKV